MPFLGRSWGEAITWYLRDTSTWTNAQLHKALQQPRYRMAVDSWLEQRSYLTNAIRVLTVSGETAYKGARGGVAT